MKRTFVNLFWIWVLTMVSTQAGISNETVTLKMIQTRTIDACSDSKKFQITVDIGSISQKDSLVGFNFRARYDNTKLKIEPYMITTGTLCENFYYTDMTINHDSSTFQGYGGNLTTPTQGSKPLFVFIGEMLSDCVDTAYIEVDYLEFTPEFKKNVVIGDPAVIFSQVTEKEDRKISINADDEVEVSNIKDKTVSVEVDIKDESKVNSFDLRIKSIDEKNVISNINLLTDNVSVQSQSISSFEKLIKIESFEDYDTQELLNFQISNDKDLELESKIEISIENINDCNCVYSINNDTITVINKVEAVSIEENEIRDFKYTFSNGIFQIDSKHNIENIFIYDLNGSIIKSDIVNNEYYECKINNIAKQAIFVVIKMNNRNEIITLINN